MSKPEQVLIIDPQHELRFRGPFTLAVLSFMKLTNPSDRKVFFKIKTTAPKRYCVRPNSGELDPGKSTEIGISLQPFLFDPAEKNKHKFMVQSLYAPDGDVNLDQLWKDVTTEQLMDTKLKCVFEMPNEIEAENENEEEGAAAGTGAYVAARDTKLSPKAAAQHGSAAAAPAIDAELKKAAEEVQQLREEESSLRQENMQLKEEILNLKISSGSGKVPQTNRYTPPAQQQQVPVFYMAIAVIMGFLGIVLGKFIL